MKKILLTLALTVSVVTMSYAKSYGIWIMGVQVTDENKDDVLGNGMITFFQSDFPVSSNISGFLLLNEGTIEVPFTKKNGKFTYDCFICVPSTSQTKAYTKNTEITYSSDVSIGSLYIETNGEVHIINTHDEVSMDSIHHDCIFTNVFTVFEGQGSLYLEGFNDYTVHCKNSNLTFRSGRYFFKNTLRPQADEDEWHSLIYQEGWGRLIFQDAFLQLRKGGDFYSSVIYSDEVVDDGIAAFVSPEGHIFKDVYFTSGNLLTREWGSGTKARRLRNVDIYPKNFPFILDDPKTNGYDQWITWDNHDDVLNDGGSVRFDYATNTLYLKYADIDLKNQMLKVGVDSLNILCFGQNRIYGALDTLGLFRHRYYHYSVPIDLNTYVQAPSFANYSFLGTDGTDGTLKTIQYKNTGKDSLIISNTKGDAMYSNLFVDGATVVCQSPKGQDAYKGKAEAELKIDNGNYALFGNETYFPIAIDGVQVDKKILNDLNQQYGSQFSYDPATNTVMLTNADMSSKKLKFIQRGQLIVNGACQLGSLVTDYDMDIVAPGTLTCSGKDDALVVAGNKTVNISGGGSLSFTGRLHGFLCGSTNYSGNLTVNNTSVTFSTTSKTNETVSNMGSLILKKAVITAPANAQFLASKNSVCVNRVPTTANVVIAPTTSDAMISEVKLTADVESVRDQEGSAKLSAFVKGNGTAKLYAQWYRKDDDDQQWWTSGSQITISTTDALAGKTLEKTFSPDDENSAYIQYRLMVRTGNTTGTKDTLYSNVLEMPIEYKVQLKDGGYAYWINDDMGTNINRGDTKDLWIRSSDVVTLGITDECAGKLGQFNLGTSWSYSGIYTITNVNHSAGYVQAYYTKLDIKFYSSEEKSSETLLKEYSSIQPNPFVCGESFSSKGFTVPTAPEKQSAFIGWLDDIAGVIYSQDQMETKKMQDDRDFVAIYEEDMEDPTAIKEVPAALLKSEKILFNGQVYIRYNGKLYNVTGMVL